VVAAVDSAAVEMLQIFFLAFARSFMVVFEIKHFYQSERLYYLGLTTSDVHNSDKTKLLFFTLHVEKNSFRRMSWFVYVIWAFALLCRVADCTTGNNPFFPHIHIM
jgi:hypothetical protein